MDLNSFFVRIGQNIFSIFNFTHQAREPLANDLGAAMIASALRQDYQIAFLFHLQVSECPSILLGEHRNMEFTFRIASHEDAEPIATLVNRAYRPRAGGQGWTHESALVTGDRTTTEQVASLLRPDSMIFVMCRNGDIVACVNLQIKDEFAHIGLLATEPHMQAQGLGKQMLNHVEEYAKRHFNPSAFKMLVLSARTELVDFYRRRGYNQTDEAEGYPVAAGIGTPLLAGLQVQTLVKRLTTLSTSS